LLLARIERTHPHFGIRRSGSRRRRTWPAVSISRWLSLLRSCTDRAISALSFCCSSPRFFAARGRLRVPPRLLDSRRAKRLSFAAASLDLGLPRQKAHAGKACGQQDDRKRNTDLRIADRGERCQSMNDMLALLHVIQIMFPKLPLARLKRVMGWPPYGRAR